MIKILTMLALTMYISANNHVGFDIPPRPDAIEILNQLTQPITRYPCVHTGYGYTEGLDVLDRLDNIERDTERTRNNIYISDLNDMLYLGD